jgi:bleomycin hydrolase
MRRFLNVMFLAGLLTLSALAQDNTNNFKIQAIVKHFPVLNQGSTGTCWSFATTSFLESEIVRKGYPETDLSEMYFVYHAWMNRAKKYLLYHGNNNLGQGGQAHDVMDVLRVHGMVRQEDYPGLLVDGRYNHRDLTAEIKAETERLNGSRNGFTSGDLENLKNILNDHLGKLPLSISTGDGVLSPVEFRDKYQIDPDDYVELTSFSHHPFYKSFVLEVPDNWAHGLYYNLPVDELMEVMFHALENGFTICWDGDTSERTFSHNRGLAELPRKQRGKVDQDLRQETFYSRNTTDDHLMHIVGLSADDEGRTCFYTKNSWGDSSNNLGGYLHMTEDYVRLKTIAILVHKESLPAAIRQKLNLQ